MKMKLKIMAIMGFSLLLNSCGGSNTKHHAEALCSSVKEVGLDKSFRVTALSDREYSRNLEKKAEQILPEAILNILKDIEKDIADLSKNEKKEYTKSLLKDIIDTDCSDMLLGQVPFDMLGLGIGELEREIERQKKRQLEEVF